MHILKKDLALGFAINFEYFFFIVQVVLGKIHLVPARQEVWYAYS